MSYKPQGFTDGQILYASQLNKIETAIVNLETELTNSRVKIVTIMLPTENWVAEGNVYKQTVNVPGVTLNSKINLQPTPEQLSQLTTSEIALTTVNDNGSVSVYAIGGIPTWSFSIQASIVGVTSE